MLSFTEENYLKAIYHLSTSCSEGVSTNALAEALNTKPASVTDMLQKLEKKKLINYQKYKGVSLSVKGKGFALQVIRKHRLWEVFLVDKLKFNWDEVHEIAEQLEHIQSSVLTERLDEFLGFPSFDPHGDPIPNAQGEFKSVKKTALSEIEMDSLGTVVGLGETSSVFLQYLDKAGIYLGAKIKVLEQNAFDRSLEIKIDNKKVITVSNEVAKNIFLTN